MLITKNDLYLALEQNRALFHDEDIIDDDVYFELFLAKPEMKKAGNGSRRLMNRIDKQQRIILCQELTTHILHNDKCFICGKKHCRKICRPQILNKSFNNYSLNLFSRASIPSSGTLCPIISYMELWQLKNSSTKDNWARIGKNGTEIDTNRIYICRDCVKDFEVKAKLEAQEVLKLTGYEFWSWYNDERNKDDWRIKLFKKQVAPIPRKDARKYPFLIDDAFQILSVNDIVHWESEAFVEYQKIEQKEIQEKKRHQQLIEEAKFQKLHDEEKERERVRKSNELFLARKQKDTPTQMYINTFCLSTSDVDITDKSIIHQALCPEGVDYEQIQKHNCTLYSEYLKTPLWKIISSKVKWIAGRKCEMCGSTRNLQVHHLSYDFKGVEFLNFGLLQCLCKECHKKMHEDYGMGT